MSAQTIPFTRGIAAIEDAANTIPTHDEFVAGLEVMDASRSGDSWTCPAHDDSRPSLAVNESDDGRLLLHCHSGCEFADVIQAWRDNLDGEVPNVTVNGHKPPKSKSSMPTLEALNNRMLSFSATHPAVQHAEQYRNIDAFTLQRFKVGVHTNRFGLDCLSLDIVMNNEIVGNVSIDARPSGIVDRVAVKATGQRGLFPAPENFAGSTCILVEGELDALAVNSLGLDAVGAPGAAIWKNDWSERFERFERVVVIYDCDEAGRKGSQRAAKALRAVAEVSVLNLDPERSDGYDIGDWINGGNDEEALEALIASDAQPVVQQVSHSGDIGNAQRYVAVNGERVFWTSALGWFVWNGQKWESDDLLVHQKLGTEVVNAIGQEAARAPDDASRKSLYEQAAKLSMHGKKVAMIAEAQPLLARAVDELDSSPTLNVANGILDLESRELTPHDPSQTHTKIGRAGYDPDADNERWIQFVREILPDESVRGFVQVAVGSMLLRQHSDFFLFLYGTGRNGKSKFCDAISYALGDYAGPVEASALLVQNPHGASAANYSAQASLRGKRLVVTSEVAHGQAFAEAVVKKITGESRIETKLMGKDFFEFDNTSSLLFMANHKPVVQGQDVAIWERIYLIPFEQQFLASDEGTEPSDVLEAKLRSEADGIFAWMVEGLRRYLANGRKLDVPDAVRAAVEEYKRASDPIGDFFGEVVELVPGNETREAWLSNETLWNRFRQYSDESLDTYLTRDEFWTTPAQRGCKSKRRKVNGNNIRGWQGVRLV